MSMATQDTGNLRERVANAPVGAEAPKGKTLQDEVRSLMPQLAAGLPPGTLSPERFVRMILTEIRKTPELLNCARESFLGAMMTTAQLGLEVGSALGQAYLIPYRDRKRNIVECTLLIGYKGWSILAARSGILIEAREVREGDTFDFSFGTSSELHHTWKLGDQRGGVIGYYATATFADGRKRFNVMSLDDIEARKNRSQVRSDRGPWKTDPVAMSMKTAIRALIPQLPLTAELGHALETDEGIVTMRGENMSVSFPDPADQEVGGGSPAIPATASQDDEQPQSVNGGPAPTQEHLDLIEEFDLQLDSVPAATASQIQSFLVQKFPSNVEMTPDDLRWAIAIVANWEQDQGATSDPGAPAEAQETAPAPSDAPIEATATSVSPDGDPGPAVPLPEDDGYVADEMPLDDAPGQKVVFGDPALETQIRASLAGMPAPKVRELCGLYGVKVEGKLDVLRLRLLPVLLAEHQVGNQAVRDLF